MSSKHVFPLILDGPAQAVTSSSDKWNGLTSYITVSNSGSGYTFTLEKDANEPLRPGTVVFVIKTDANSNTITVNPSEDFDNTNTPSVVLGADNESVAFIYSGENTAAGVPKWRLFGENQTNTSNFDGGTVGSATTFSSALTLADAVKLDVSSTAAVAEATNRATGVTLNQVAGVVSTNAASLADATAATLTVTNSVCTANSVVVVVPGTNFNDLGGSSIEVTPAAGSFTIEYKNVSGGAVATAQTFRFVVLNLV
jgi:hypothetical protein